MSLWDELVTAVEGLLDGSSHASDVPKYAGHPPRLVVALNDTPVPIPDGDDTATELKWRELDPEQPASLSKVLRWVADRLELGLRDCWAGPAGCNEDWPDREPEEQWARAFSELFFGIRYGGPGQTYFSNPRMDAYIFRRIQKTYRYEYTKKEQAELTAKNPEWVNPGVMTNSDPAVSLTAACQHCTTYGTITRGFTIEDHLLFAGYGARQQDTQPIFKLPGGKWYPTDTQHLQAPVATGQKAPVAPVGAEQSMGPLSPAAGPGSIYTYNPWGDAKKVKVYVPKSEVPKTKEETEKLRDKVTEAQSDNDLSYYKPRTVLNPALAPVDPDANASPQMPSEEALAAMEEETEEVELDPTGQRKGSHIMHILRVSKDKTKVQLFNTSNGYPLTLHEEHTIMGPTGRAGIYDGNFISDVPAGNKYCGMGVVPEKPPVPLDEMASFMRKARPVGLVRLVVVKRKAAANDVTDADILFVSRLVRMYNDQEDQNYTIARYAWSLRQMPGYRSMQAYWVVFIPRGKLAELMWAEGARKMKVKDFVGGVQAAEQKRVELRRITKNNPKIPDAEAVLSYNTDFYDIVTISVDDMGKALYWQRKKSVLNFGSTSEGAQGNPVPTAIRARVAPKPNSDKKLFVPWNGQYFHPMMLNAATGQSIVDMPDYFLDGDQHTEGWEADPIETGDISPAPAEEAT